MAVKLLMTWDMVPGREQEYFEFLVREFVPGMQRLGIQPTEAWYTTYGEAPQMLTGFVAGSLLLIWPWKIELTQAITLDDEVKEKVIGYQWLAPDLSLQTLVALGLIVAGFLAVWLMEKAGGPRGKDGKAES